MAHPPAPARAPDARLVSKLEPVLAVASFAAFPVVQLLAVNAGQIVPADALRSLAISVLLGIFILSAAGVATGTCF